jgi:hypothetical protein
MKKHTTTVTLTDQDKFSLRTAAWGAVSLMSAAGSAHKVATHESIALTSATGTVGHVLTKAPKGIKYGKTVASLADVVLATLTEAMSLLEQEDAAGADNFRATVLVTIDASAQAQKGEPGPALVQG